MSCCSCCDSSQVRDAKPVEPVAQPEKEKQQQQSSCPVQHILVNSVMSPALPPSGGDGATSSFDAATVKRNPKVVWPPARNFPAKDGFMTEGLRRKFIKWSQEKGLMPAVAHRMPDIVSLNAPIDDSKPIQWWQLYSLIGEAPLYKPVCHFYDLVWKDEDWFKKHFVRGGEQWRHEQLQMAFWLDAFGGNETGLPSYHGGETRAHFNHISSAQIMNRKGTERWIEHMEVVLDTACAGPDGELFKFTGGNEKLVARVRRSINTFLAFLMDRYGNEFDYEYGAPAGSKHKIPFGERNEKYPEDDKQPVELLTEEEAALPSEDTRIATDPKHKRVQGVAINWSIYLSLPCLSEELLRCGEMHEGDLRGTLLRHGVDLSEIKEYEDLVEKACEVRKKLLENKK